MYLVFVWEIGIRFYLFSEGFFLIVMSFFYFVNWNVEYIRSCDFVSKNIVEEFVG